MAEIEIMTARDFVRAMKFGRSDFSGVRFVESIDLWVKVANFSKINWRGQTSLRFTDAVFEGNFDFYGFGEGLSIDTIDFDGARFQQKSAFGHITADVFSAKKATFADWTSFVAMSVRVLNLAGADPRKKYQIRKSPIRERLCVRDTTLPFEILEREHLGPNCVVVT